MISVLSILLFLISIPATVFGGELYTNTFKHFAAGVETSGDPTFAAVICWVGALVVLGVGLLAVIKGGDWFVDSASWIARAGGIPPFIIGATIVSVATTLPEIIVSCSAAAQGGIDMAIGNAVGSVTANSAMIMTLSFIFLTIAIVRKDYIVQCLMLIATATLLLVGSLGGSLSVVASVVLLCIFVAFMILNVVNAKKHSASDAAEEKEPVTKKAVAGNIFQFIESAVIIVGGARMLVAGGTWIAQLLGVPERIIAVTLVAIGTSLPELVTTVTAIRKKQATLSIGNIVGANIIDLSLILPLCSLIAGKPLPVSAEVLTLDLPLCLGVLLLLLVPLLIRQKAGRWQGIAGLTVYGAYIVYLVIQAVSVAA